MSRDYCEGDFCYQKKARTECFKPEVWSMLHKIVARVGRLEITSGCDGKHARHSYHYRGQAVDFRPMQATVQATLALLRSMSEVGGIGSYSTGLIHADVRPTRVAWYGSRKSRFSGFSYTRVASARYARASLGDDATLGDEAAPGDPPTTLGDMARDDSGAPVRDAGARRADRAGVTSVATVPRARVRAAERTQVASADPARRANARLAAEARAAYWRYSRAGLADKAQVAQVAYWQHARGAGND